MPTGARAAQRPQYIAKEKPRLREKPRPIAVAHGKAFLYEAPSWPQEQGLNQRLLWEQMLLLQVPASPVLKLQGPGQAIETTQGLEATRPGQDHACRLMGEGGLELGPPDKKVT